MARSDGRLIPVSDRGPEAPPFQMIGAREASRDLDCLATAVYYEARGESAAGQAAVAQVVLNRVRHPAFPKTVCGVVFQGANTGSCQFSFACNGAMRRTKEPGPWSTARSVAARALGGYVMTDVGQAVSFHVARLGDIWGGGMTRVSQVGSHVFYRFGGRYAAAGPVRAVAYAADARGVDAIAILTRPVDAAATASATEAVQLASAAVTAAPRPAKDAAATSQPPAKSADAPKAADTAGKATSAS